MLIRKSALVNILSAACIEASRQLIRDFNELAFLKANRRIDQFVENTRERALEIIQTQLLKSNPGHGIIYNNATFKASETGLVWIVNPIDCVENFVHRIPFFGTCIALAQEEKIKNHEAIAAMFFDPIRDETFWAEQNQGTFLNAKKLMLAQLNVSQQMKIHPGKEDFAMPLMVAGCGQTQETRANRNFGSNTMHMAYVAANRLDATYEKIDDIANICTGKLLVIEARGEVVLNKDGKMIIAHNRCFDIAHA